MDSQSNSTTMSGIRRSRSYLLRLWQEEPDSPWRAMLRCVTGQENQLFHDLEELIAFLRVEIDKTECPNPKVD